MFVSHPLLYCGFALYTSLHLFRVGRDSLLFWSSVHSLAFFHSFYPTLNDRHCLSMRVRVRMSIYIFSARLMEEEKSIFNFLCRTFFLFSTFSGWFWFDCKRSAAVHRSAFVGARVIHRRSDVKLVPRGIWIPLRNRNRLEPLITPNEWQPKWDFRYTNTWTTRM